jgi:CheY-like chemotaxis protein
MQRFWESHHCGCAVRHARRPRLMAHRSAQVAMGRCARARACSRPCLVFPGLLHEPALGHTQPGMAASVTPPVRGTVLVVDDEDGILRVLRRVLRGHEVVTVRDGHDALEVVESRGPDFDLVLCDVAMPRMGGVRLWNELETRKPELLPKIVFMTGGLICAADADFFAARRPMTIDKPFHIDDVRQLVQLYVTEHRSTHVVARAA